MVGVMSVMVARDWRLLLVCPLSLSVIGIEGIVLKNLMLVWLGVVRSDAHGGEMVGISDCPRMCQNVRPVSASPDFPY